MEKYSKKILMMPVYSVQEGQNLGLIKALVIDPKAKKVLALILEKRRMGKEERLVPFLNIKSIGDSAVIIDKAEGAERKNDLPPLMRYLRNPVQLIGSKVFTTGGHTLGRVEEYRFDDKTGVLTALELTGSNHSPQKGRCRLDGQYLITIAPGTVMVDEEALDYLEPLEQPGRSAVSAALDTAGTVLANTLDGAKKFSQNIARPRPEEGELSHEEIIEECFTTAEATPVPDRPEE